MDAPQRERRMPSKGSSSREERATYQGSMHTCLSQVLSLSCSSRMHSRPSSFLGRFLARLGDAARVLYRTTVVPVSVSVSAGCRRRRLGSTGPGWGPGVGME